jgi:copper chaperone CopZ
MKRNNVIAIAAALTLCVAGSAWAGGAACESKASGATKASSGAKASGDACMYKSDASAKSASSGHACPMTGGKEASADQCGVKAGQVMYSFAVPGAECDNCSDAIQKAALETKGITCAHVDLGTHTAYLIADKSVSKDAIGKVIQKAGFKNAYKASGAKVEQEFFAAMKTSHSKGMSCCMKEKKDKV